MTDTWIARGEIRWADSKAENKSDTKVFAPGDTVSGPSKEEMERLAEVGAIAKKSDLEKREAPEGESDLEKEYAARLKEKDDEIVELRAKLAAAEGKQNTPAAEGVRQQAAKTTGSTK